jgi:hypothetical protein
MNKKEFVEECIDLTEELSEVCEKILRLKHDLLSVTPDPSPELDQAETELADLEEKINLTLYRSFEFFDLKEKIDSKEKQIEELKSQEKNDPEVEIINENYEILERIAYEANDEQYAVWNNLKKIIEE